ncbi:MAG TPA: transposase [Candidatus Nitrosocosmicus sp.]
MEIDNKINEFEDGYITIATDSTCKGYSRSWIREKWKSRNNNSKKGYLKIHIVVNVKTKKILSIEITDEHVHDTKMYPN